MRRYLLRRLLLMPPTLFGIMLIAFLLTRFVPGGPLEQALAEARAAREEHAGRAGATQTGSESLSPEQTQKLKELYGLDRPGIPAFFEWLGIMPKNLPNSATVTFDPKNPGSKVVSLSAPVPTDRDEPFQFEAHAELRDGVPVVSVPSDLKSRLEKWERNREKEIRETPGRKPGDLEKDLAHFEDEKVAARTALRPWYASLVRLEDERPGFMAAIGNLFSLKYKPLEPGKPVSVKVYQRAHSGLLQGDFGNSFLHGRPALDLILERAPTSAWLGVLALGLTYLIAVPLGVLKAVRHGGVTDNITSFLIFFAASIPSYIIAAMLLQVFAYKLHWFPLQHLVSDDFDAMSFPAKAADLLRHTVLPLTALTVGQIAMMTLLMKNSLVENLGSDYVRTAIAKGVPFRRAVTEHAFRLSLVPIATGFGNCIGVLLTGNFIIEQIFDINGYGLLSYQALVGRDYPVFLAGLVIGAVLLLVGNILSDICVALVDPRIRFDK